MTTTTDNATIDEVLDEVAHLTALPEITMRVIEIANDPSSGARDLHDVVAHDVALASRILRVVNSAFYGRSGQIGSINRAIGLLGLSGVRNVAISVSMQQMYRGGRISPRFDARELWLHSMGVAIGGKLICDELGLKVPDEIFLAGLLHDIGITVEMHAKRRELAGLFLRLDLDDDGRPSTDMRELERELFGADHEQFGARLCEHWKFPRPLIDCAGHHHDPLALPDDRRRMPAIVCTADRLAGMLGLGFHADLTDLAPPCEVLDLLEATHEQLSRVSEELPAAYEEVSVLLDG